MQSSQARYVAWGGLQATFGRSRARSRAELLAVRGELRDHRVEPRVAVVERRLGGDHPEQPRVLVQRRHASDEIAGGGIGGHDQRRLERRQVERLRGRGHGDAPTARRIRHLEPRDVGRAGKRQRRVDLVRQHPHLVLGAPLGDRLELARAGARDRSGCGGWPAPARGHRPPAPRRVRRGRASRRRAGPR